MRFLPALLLLTLAVARAQTPQPAPSPASIPADPAKPESESQAPEAEAAEETPAGAKEEAPAAAPAKPSGAALRNENVFASKMDTDSQKADNIRLGIEYVILSQPKVEANHYASEYGRAASEIVVLGKPPAVNSWHGEFFETLQNSVFNARTFFQVGAVAPSGSNTYGAQFSGGLGWLGSLSGSFNRGRNRGMVNGNVLVPLPSEREPLATDPATRAIVSRILAAYPNEVPNRPDFDPRALNINAPQLIRTTDGSLRLDRTFGPNHQLSLFHTISRQNIDAFQLVAGMNPDTSLHSQRSQITYRFAPSENTEYSVGGSYLRSRANLTPEPNAVGPRIRMGRAVQELGPDDQYPLDRIENTFRYGGLGYRRIGGSAHRLTFGGDFIRYQMNGFEQNTQRGSFNFGANFGRSSLENLLLGLPTSYSVQIGNMIRGFRAWTTDVFIGDEWRAGSRVQVYLGLRHTANSAPVEVNRLNTLPYKDDLNNFSPSLAFAVQGPMHWVVRASYSISFGQILPVTFSQIRYNPPGAIRVEVANPSMVRPLAGVDLSGAGSRSSIVQFSPDLVSPYTHQYNFTLQRSIGDILNLEMGYVGSRTVKLLTAFHLNRADAVPGIDLTTGTVNERRPDPRYYDVNLITNSGMAYLDAARLGWSIPSRGGLALGGNFTFSKALDTGATYTSTAANKDLGARSQWQYEVHKDKKALSDFDSTRSFSVYGNYRWPQFVNRWKPVGWFTNGWEISSTLLLKTGTPFNVYTGSDAPGFGNVDGAGADRPNILDPSILGATIDNPDTSPEILRHDRFAFIQPGAHRGNIAFNAFRKHGIRNVNAAVTREWRWGRQRIYTLRFRGEAFNLGNHPQFDAPQYVLSSPSFGRITNTLNNGRVLQFGLRLML